MDYSRQLKLDFLDIQGQQQLAHSRIIVFGAGGLACTALSYLAASGIGHITIVDADSIEKHNLHRQILYTASDIGHFKAQISAQKIARNYPHCRTQAIKEFLRDADLLTQLEQHHIAIDCTDDAAFSLALNKMCCVLHKPVVFANASRMQGQLFVYNGSTTDACLCCLWGESMQPNTQNCDGLGVLGPIPGILGCMQAIEAIKLILRQPKAPALNNALLQCDFLNHAYQTFTLQKNPTCSHHLSTQADLVASYDNMPTRIQHIFQGSLQQALNAHYTIIDICNLGERPQPLEVTHTHISIEELTNNYAHYIDANKYYLLVCKTGKRSTHLQQFLNAQGLTNIAAFVQK